MPGFLLLCADESPYLWRLPSWRGGESRAASAVLSERLKNVAIPLELKPVKSQTGSSAAHRQSAGHRAAAVSPHTFLLAPRFAGKGQPNSSHTEEARVASSSSSCALGASTYASTFPKARVQIVGTPEGKLAPRRAKDVALRKTVWKNAGVASRKREKSPQKSRFLVHTPQIKSGAVRLKTGCVGSKASDVQMSHCLVAFPALWRGVASVSWAKCALTPFPVRQTLEDRADFPLTDEPK